MLWLLEWAEALPDFILQNASKLFYNKGTYLANRMLDA